MIDKDDLKYAKFSAEEVEKYSLQENDLLTIRSNGSISLVGKTSIVSKADTSSLFAGYLIRLRPLKEVLDGKFVLYSLSSPELRNQIEFKARSTSGVNNINSEEIKSLKIPLTSKEEQRHIVQEIESRLSVCGHLEQEIEKALRKSEALRQSILKKAFEGRLVPQDPNDEPAEALLERIRRERKADKRHGQV